MLLLFYACVILFCVFFRIMSFLTSNDSQKDADILRKSDDQKIQPIPDVSEVAELVDNQSSCQHFE